MANPFFIEPANPLQALMTGEKAYDRVQKSAQDDLLKSIGDQIGSGNMDYHTAAATAAKAGRLDLALPLLKMGEEGKASAEFSRMFGGGASQPQQPSARGQSPLMPLMMPDEQPPAAVRPPTQPVQQATEGIISAVTPDGRDIAPNTTAAPQTMPSPNGPGTSSPMFGRPQPQTGPAVPAVNQNITNIPALIAAASNPRLPEAQRMIAKSLLEHAQKTGDLPAEQKNYELYRRQGGNDDFTTWERKNKTAGATMINTAEGMDAAQTKARIAIDTHAIQDLSKKAVQGRSALPLVEKILELSDKTPGGMAGSVSPFIARALSGLGIDVPENLSNAELVASLSRQFIPAVRDPGSTSNYEQQLYSQAVPGLAQSKEGRLKIGQMFKAQIERNNEILKIYRQNVGSPDLDQKLSELDNKPMFSPQDRKYLEAEAAKATQGGAGATGGNVSEGATATNPKTGQRIIFKGGQWQPAQ